MGNSQLKIIALAVLSVCSNVAKANDTVQPTEQAAENANVPVASDARFYEENGLTYSSDLTELKKVDRRKKKSKSSPAYLDAVGHIIVYHNDGQKNTCSGTLISTIPGQSSRTIQSAGHCFGDTETNKKSDIKKITWNVTTKSGQKISKTLRIEYLNLRADDAILSFEGKIPFSTIQPALVDAEVVLEVGDMLLYNNDANIVVAGHSANDYKGDRGLTLTYDDSIQLRNYHYRPDLFLIDSLETVVFSGASGGAVLVNTDLSEEGVQNPYGQMLYAGTILSLAGHHVLYRESNVSSTTGGKYMNFRSYEMIDIELVNRLNQ
ncbi:hypothetical protein [Shewanella litorisediminis]|uniref:Peptidase S1 domain-containing protein n=1 Tax=Shewanella litorisediminis TaxID=1173586 RepID=A0ABX7G5A4_9GAMM|nr:hypothetical protein [Shewanella litorisediminis]MCL2920229.1 hypothetical protein [Shewanella litorisediminis]QRH02505.1 hypothetical protein JQC75_03520 [Shewanella litorisediminis]